MSKKTPKFHCSAASRWLNCPAAPHVQKPSPPNVWSIEGTNAHGEGEKLLVNYQKTDKEKLSDRYELDAYLNYIYGRTAFCDFKIEWKQKLKALNNLVSGKSDCVIFDFPDLIEIVDLKYGAGIKEHAKNNPQAILYALIALEHFPSYKNIAITIVQPRIDSRKGPVDTWVTTADHLWNAWFPKFEAAIERSMKPNGHLVTVPGPWCHWCTGAIDCASVNRGIELAKEIEEKYKNKDTIPYSKLLKILRSEPGIMQAIRYAKQIAFDMKMRGREVDGYKIVQSEGNRIFTNPNIVEKKLSRYNLDLYEKKLKTPPQLEKGQPKKIRDKIDKLTHRPDRGLQLVPVSDNRPEFIASTDFDGLDDD